MSIKIVDARYHKELSLLKGLMEENFGASLSMNKHRYPLWEAHSQVKQQKHHAETRDPPSQDPRDHMAQADRHNNSPTMTSKQTTTTAASQRELKRKVKRTVKDI